MDRWVDGGMNEEDGWVQFGYVGRPAWVRIRGGMWMGGEQVVD